MLCMNSSNLIFSLLWTLCLIILFVSLVDTSKAKTKGQIVHIDDSPMLAFALPSNYNNLEPPPGLNGRPPVVTLSAVILSIRKIDEKDEQVTIELNLRMRWRAPRLQHLVPDKDDPKNYVALDEGMLATIWHPDIFVEHAISIVQPSLDTKPPYLRMYRDCVMEYSSRVLVTMGCKMLFKFYPADTQRCRVQLKSYRYADKKLALEWLPSTNVTLEKGLKLNNFGLQVHNISTSIFYSVSRGNFSNCEFTISLQRAISYHVIQTYIPSMIFLIISWLLFLVAREKVAERIRAIVITELSLTVMLSSVNQGMPKVSYLSALHIWMFACIFLVFLALTEFILILKIWSHADVIDEEIIKLKKLKLEEMENGNLSFKSDKLDEVKEGSTIQDINETDNKDSDKSQIHLKNQEQLEKLENKIMDKDKDKDFVPTMDSIDTKLKEKEMKKKLERIGYILEKCSISLFIGIFFIFNIIYWPWLFICSGYQFTYQNEQEYPK